MMITAFDMEGTLTNGRTARTLGAYLETHGQKSEYRRMFWLRSPGYVLWKAGLRSEARFKHLWMNHLARLWAGMTEDQLDEMAEWVVEYDLWPNRRTDVIAELEAHRANGDRVVIASGNFTFIVAAFARRLGVTEYVGSPLAMNGEGCAGHSAGPMRIGPLKVMNLLTYLNGELPDAAYGDTGADVALLQQVKHPTAVYPDPHLRDIAQRNGWRILEGSVLTSP